MNADDDASEWPSQRWSTDRNFSDTITSFESFLKALTVPRPPPPKRLSDEDIDRQLARQLSNCPFLGLPREVIDKITSYIATPAAVQYAASKGYFQNPWAALLPFPFFGALGSARLTRQAADLASLALTCRYLLSILHPTVHTLLTCGADVVFEERLSGSRESRNGATERAPERPSDLRSLTSATVIVVERLHKDRQEARRSGGADVAALDFVQEIFEKDVLGVYEDMRVSQVMQHLKGKMPTLRS